jgi:hypothetical protein
MVSSLIAASSGDVQKDPREKKMYGILYVSNKIQRVEKETPGESSQLRHGT